MRRRSFLAATAAASLLASVAPRRVFAQGMPSGDADPAMSSPEASLRVLLGEGQAEAIGNDAFLFNGNRYRGSFSVLADGRVVNDVPLEAYLYSVMPLEMSPGWPSAALQAQAICARTYVLQRSNPRRDYDLVPSEADQVYGGTRSESDAARAAVDATAGRVLRYGSAFAQIAYSACCGGHTEASSAAWGGAGFPYLEGVVCPYCDESPNYRWTADVPVDEVEQAFGAALAATGGTLRNVRVAAQDASGRATAVQLATDGGGTVIRGSAFRSGLGNRVIKSLRIYQLAMTGAGTLHAEGGGLGHGVGLCQWGARGYASRGGSAADIVGFYFPGTVIGNA